MHQQQAAAAHEGKCYGEGVEPSMLTNGTLLQEEGAHLQCRVASTSLYQSLWACLDCKDLGGWVGASLLCQLLIAADLVVHGIVCNCNCNCSYSCNNELVGWKPTDRVSSNMASLTGICGRR
jgi:hypothetical protein